MYTLILLVLLVFGVPIFGFDDFTYNGVFYDNPAGDIALIVGGQVVKVDWYTVEALRLDGPGLGIGLDVNTKRAYINYTLASAGDYECGHLYARLLKTHPCSLFVHVPSKPNIYDLVIIAQANIGVWLCQYL